MRTTTALIAVLLVWGGPVFAAVWDAGGDGTLWTNPANWNPDGVPGPGDVAGIGGSVATGPPGRLRYVTGRVVLDQELFADFGPREAPFAQAIVDHKLAHVVGLGHVDDPGELMYDDNLGRTTYGPGDREGLARLGSISC